MPSGAVLAGWGSLVESSHQGRYLSALLTLVCARLCTGPDAVHGLCNRGGVSPGKSVARAGLLRICGGDKPASRYCSPNPGSRKLLRKQLSCGGVSFPLVCIRKVVSEVFIQMIRLNTPVEKLWIKINVLCLSL